MPSLASRPVALGLLLPLGLGALLAGCTPPGASINLSPEAAVQACEGPAALALRARDASFQSVILDPAAASRIERRGAHVGSQPLAMVVSGQGTARTGSAIADLRYVCLIGPEGRALFVDIETLNGGAALAECAKPAGGSVRSCLESLLHKAERGLAEAEARAVARARSARPKAPRVEIDEPVATSIGAWRVYRDAECTRRQEAAPGDSPELGAACRVQLTRERVRELGG
jgi:hypothetical protein